MVPDVVILPTAFGAPCRRVVGVQVAVPFGAQLTCAMLVDASEPPTSKRIGTTQLPPQVVVVAVLVVLIVPGPTSKMASRAALILFLSSVLVAVVLTVLYLKVLHLVTAGFVSAQSSISSSLTAPENASFCCS